MSKMWMLVVLLILSGWDASAAWLNPRERDPNFDPSKVSIAMGIPHRFNESKEYCQRSGGRLLSAEEALEFYKTTLDAQKKTGLRNFGNNDTSGSFWTGNRGGIMACPVALIIGTDINGADLAITFEAYCSKQARFLTICVKDSQAENRMGPARNTDQPHSTL